MDPLANAGTIAHPLKAPEDVGAVRRLVRAIAFKMGASDADCGRAELVATELGTNILHHARSLGSLMVQPLAPPHGRGIEVLAVDHGPGIRDLTRVLRGAAGRTSEASALTAGDHPPQGLGCGLSSVQRLASEFDIHTSESGTVVLARFFFDPPGRLEGLRWGAVSVPLLGETENGDAWAFAPQTDGGCSVLVADGLGHGPEAALASQAAIATLRRAPEVDLESYVRVANRALRPTRGAAVSLCRISLRDNRLEFAGLGNVDGRVLCNEKSVGLVPRNGTLGMNATPPKIDVRVTTWAPGSLLVLHSDGVRQHFDLGTLRDLHRRDPTVIAAVLHRDHGRGRDDATVLVVRDTRDGRS